jgi:hypothetical protein
MGGAVLNDQEPFLKNSIFFSDTPRDDGCETPFSVHLFPCRETPERTIETALGRSDSLMRRQINVFWSTFLCQLSLGRHQKLLPKAIAPRIGYDCVR